VFFENALGPALGHAAHLARERMNARLAGWDITPAQTRVLLYLQENGGGAPQCEVTRLMRVRPSTANGILDRLEEKGLVRRSISGSDARRRLITLTEKGRERQSQFLQVHREAEEVIVRGFSPEEAEALRRLLDRVIENLEEDRTLC